MRCMECDRPSLNPLEFLWKNFLISDFYHAYKFMVKIYYVDTEVTEFILRGPGKFQQTVGAGLMLPELRLQRAVLVMA